MRQMPLGRKEISFYKIVKLILRIWMSYVWCQFVKDFKNWHHRFFSFWEMTSEITQFWIYFKTMTSVFDKCQVLTYENSYPVKNYGRRIKLYDLYWTLDWLKFYHQIWCYGYRLCLSILKSVINIMLIECMSILSLSDMAQEKQTCIWCHQIFPSFWKIIQSGTFEHLGGCCFANVFCQPPLCWCQWARELRNMC